MPNRLLLVDGTSLLDLIDGTSHLLLLSVPALTGTTGVVEVAGGVGRLPLVGSTAVIELAGGAGTPPASLSGTTAVIELYGNPGLVPLIPDMSSDAEWWGQLTDMTGTVKAKLPSFSPDKIIETLGQVSTTTAAVPVAANTEAANAIMAVAPTDLWGLQLQVWRGTTLWWFGPLTDAVLEAGKWTLNSSGVMAALKRRVIGRLGTNYSGWQGDPGPGDYLTNPRFASGLTGWSLLRTIGWATTGAPASVMAVSAVAPPAPGVPVVEWSTPTDINQYELYQDIEMRSLPEAELHMRFSGYVRIPSGASFVAAARQPCLRLALYPARALSDMDYFDAVLDHVEAPIPVDIPRDEWVLIETPPLKVPPLTTATLHVGVVLPGGTGQLAFPEGPLRDDGGMVAKGIDAGQLAQFLAAQAQRADLGKSTLNVSVMWTATGKPTTRTYVYDDHPKVGDAIEELANGGYFDWWEEVRPDVRYIWVAPRRGQYRPECAINDESVIAVDRYAANWGNGATAVAVQAQGKQGRHEYAAAITGVTTIEDVSTAVREATPADLLQQAARRLDITSHPEMLEVTTKAGGLQVTLLHVGDWTDVALVNADGLTLSGIWRVVKKETSPVADNAKLTLNRFTP